MNFNRHFELEGKHAFLSASKYHWINYDEERLLSVYENVKAKARGTALHEFACKAIQYGIPLGNPEDTLGMYVNDCIYDNMQPEVVLYYSPMAFGTADAISFDGDVLRIYDLKTGKTPASMNQLRIYAALFCLEYDVNPNDISFVFRIYQQQNVISHEPDGSEIWDIIDKIIAFDAILQTVDSEG